MTDLVKRIYQNQKKGKKKYIIIALGVYFCMIVMISLFQGSPLPYKEQKVFLEAEQSGWIITKLYLLIVCAVLGLAAGYGYIFISMLRDFNRIDSVMNKKCDVKAYLEGMKYAISFGKTLKFKGYQKTVFLLMQQRYVLALTAALELNNAEEYLKVDWYGKKNNRLFNRCQINLWLAKTYQDQEVKAFYEIYKKAPAVFQKNVIVKAKGLILKEQYDECLVLLNTGVSNLLYREVIRYYLMGQCYDALDNIESAAECMKYVAKHGNTMPCKNNAKEWLVKHTQTTHLKA